MKPVSFRYQFALHRTAETLNRLKDVATALTIAGGRFAALGVVGVFLHGASLAASTLVRDFGELARDWKRVAVAQELGDVALTAVRSRIVKSTNNWHMADVAGQGVLVSEGDSSACFYVERDPAAFLSFVREQVWQTLGPSTRLAPTGVWADKVDVLAADAPTDTVSEHAEDIWARCAEAIEILLAERSLSLQEIGRRVDLPLAQLRLSDIIAAAVGGAGAVDEPPPAKLDEAERAPSARCEPGEEQTISRKERIKARMEA